MPATSAAIQELYSESMSYAWLSGNSSAQFTLAINPATGAPAAIETGYGAFTDNGSTDNMGWLLHAIAEKVQQQSNLLSDVYEVVLSDVIGGLTGHGTMLYNYAYGCNVDITTVPPDLDYWWAPSDIAKYGVIRANYGAYNGELQWINSSHTRLFFTGGMCSGLTYNLFPGVVATITPFFRSVIPSVHGTNNGSEDTVIDWGKGSI